MQKIVTSAFVIGLFIASGGLSAADDAENVYKETNGTWELASSVKDGMQTPAEETKDTRLELKDGVWIYRKGDMIISKGTFAILSIADGYRVVSTKSTVGENAGKMGKHISKSEGDTLTICHAPDDQDVPKEFTSKKGSGNILNVWQRVKK